jgi:hypothetical protein
MRWFRRSVKHHPGRQDELLAEVRERFGPHVRLSPADQAAAVTELLDGDDGLAVAAGLVRAYADAAYATLSAQAGRLNIPVERRNYRAVLRHANGHLRWSPYGLAGLHPYVHITGAVRTLGLRSGRVPRVTAAEPVWVNTLEVLDLTLAGWEFARVPVDTDAAFLAEHLIRTTRGIGDAIGDPPPLPPPVRELMRSNRTFDVYDPATGRPSGGFNPGRRMRETFLV